jgi:glyoxylase-like metal-dependent hydrolase (beta-lactamase superfamily II)
MDRIDPKNWYDVQKLGDDVTYICEPFIEEFYRCNIWHVRGSKSDMLVDSGMGVVSLCEWVSIVTEKQLTAVASHTHFDHIGCHHEFEHRAVHPAEADLLAHPTRENTLATPYVTDDIFTGLPPGLYSSATYAVKKAPATQLVEDGDVIDLGNRAFEVIHTPGHSPGGIALWEERTGILFSGDIHYDGPLIEDTYHSNLVDYVASMERLLELPVRIVHGGHFPSFGAERHYTLIRNWLDEKQNNGQ